MKLPNSPCSLLHSQFLGMTSLVRYGLDSAGLVDAFWSAALMLLNMSILPLIDSFTSAFSCCITSVISCLNCCWNVARSAGVTMSAHCAAEAPATVAAAAVLRLASELLERFHSWSCSPTLRYHVKLKSILWHNLSQRECVGRIIKCARQDWETREATQLYRSAPVSSLRAVQQGA